MPTRKYRDRKKQPVELYRSAEVFRDESDDEQRSIPLVLATDTPVPVYDAERMEVVDEVLDIDRMEIPESGQIPLLDTHNRSSVRHVIGSIRDFTKSDGVLRGVAYFAADEEKLYRKYKTGDLNAFSVGAGISERKYTRRNGEVTLKTVTKSVLREGSAVIFGADPNALSELSPAMRAYIDPHELMEIEMEEQLREILAKRGLPEDVEGVEGMLRWLEDRKPESNATETERNEWKETRDSVADLQRMVKEGAGNQTDAEEKAAQAVERYAEIDGLCRKHSIEDAQRKEWLEGDISSDQVARKILELGAEDRKPVGNVSFTEGKEDKLLRAMSEGLAARTLRGTNPDKVIEVARSKGDYDAVERNQAVKDIFDKPTAESKDFRNSTLMDMARAYLDVAGVNYSSVRSPMAIMRMALNHNGLYGEARIDRTGYHNTGSFSNLMVDAMNKTLLMGYDEAETTYQMWVRTAPSASDLKELYRIKFGELPDPQVIPEGHDYPEASPSDDKESYKVLKHGHTFSGTLEMFINDDLNALQRLPAMQGAAFRRAINRDCYIPLTDNANLSDSSALFSTAHGNGANVSIDTAGLNAMYTAMRTKSGLNSTTVLNITPRYIIVPAALEATALQFFASQADPSVGGDTTGSSGVMNIYGPSGQRSNLQVIADGQLDNDSTAKWYAAASSSQIDTVELTYLQGYESPVTDENEVFKNDTLQWKATQFWATKAIDYRGLYRGGAAVS